MPDGNVHDLVLKGLNQELRALLDHDPEALSRRNVMGWTPLHVAAYAGNTEAAGLLLAYGAEREVRDLVGRTPFQLASELEHEAILKLLR
ncbi:MAG: ankyrin repeat domain-containing protein [Vulcanimicrobiota bacterium]